MSVSLWDAVADKFTESAPSPYLHDPVGWAKDRLGVHLWSMQKEIAEALVTHRRVAVKSCHDSGKSFLAGVIAAWWTDTSDVGDSFVLSTAPSYKQVHAILWEEIRKQHKRGRLRGEVLQSDVWKINGTEVGFGRKPADKDEHGFQGIHRRRVLALLDEACGVPEQLFTAAEAVTTNEDCRILAIGNPDDPNTEFGKICKPGSGWKVFTISADLTPNLSGERIPEAIRPLLLSPEWVEDKKKRWGETSPRYVSKVTGEFPDVGEDTLIRPSWITSAQEYEGDWSPDPILAVDVARHGSDRTVLGLRTGQKFRVVGDYGGIDTMETTGHVIQAIREHNVAQVRVDVVGVGAGVVDRLIERGVPVVEMQSGAAPLDPEQFKNARGEWWWGVRERFEQGHIDIDPDDDELASQLGAMKWKPTSRGQVEVERKDDMKKRGLPSPDRGDCLMMAFAHVPEWGDTFTADDLTEDEYEADTISIY
jgi:hypothetical protein